MDDFKLIAFASYSTVGGSQAAMLATFVGQNCSAFYTDGGGAVGIVNIRVGTPGPLTAIATPAAANTEWSRAVGNVLPVVTTGTGTIFGVVVPVDSTTYQVRTWDPAANAAAESIVWFGLYTLAV